MPAHGLCLVGVGYAADRELAERGRLARATRDPSDVTVARSPTVRPNPVHGRNCCSPVRSL